MKPLTAFILTSLCACAVDYDSAAGRLCELPDLPCSGGRTCVDGYCRDAAAAGPDAGDNEDAGNTDAGPDAGLSDPCGPAEVSARANLIGNGSFEQSLDGWETYSGCTGCSLARVAGGFEGANAAKMNGSQDVLLNDHPNWVATATPGAASYCFVAYVRSAGGAGTGQLVIREYDGTTQVGATGQSTVQDLSDQWLRLEVLFQKSALSGTRLDLGLEYYPGGDGQGVLVDDLRLVELAD